MPAVRKSPHGLSSCHWTAAVCPAQSQTRSCASQRTRLGQLNCDSQSLQIGAAWTDARDRTLRLRQELAFALARSSIAIDTLLKRGKSVAERYAGVTVAIGVLFVAASGARSAVHGPTYAAQVLRSRPATRHQRSHRFAVRCAVGGPPTPGRGSCASLIWRVGLFNVNERLAGTRIHPRHRIFDRTDQHLLPEASFRDT